MILPGWVIWLASFVLAIVVIRLIVKLFITSKETAAGITYMGVMVLTLVFAGITEALSATVVVVSDSGTRLTDEKIKRVFFSYEDQPVELCGKYVYNQSDEVFVLYPAYYGNGGEETQTDEEAQIIAAKSFEKVEHIPDYCFHRPNSIISKSKGAECKWILETLTEALTPKSSYGIR